jgi:hypothetical protein
MGTLQCSRAACDPPLGGQHSGRCDELNVAQITVVVFNAKSVAKRILNR